MQTQERAAAGAPDTGFAGDSLDPVDVVRGLAHMDVLLERVVAARAARRRGRASGRPTTSAEEHEMTHGHALKFGCCAYVGRAA